MEVGSSPMGISMEHILYTIDLLPSDIIRSIHNELDFVSQCNLRLASTYFTLFPITNLFDNVPNISNITNTILKLYPMITKLNAFNNEKITDFTHLINLQILDCGNDFELFPIDHDDKIIDINHLKNLRILHCSGECEIHNSSIALLTNLTELYCTDNPYITDVNHLVNLKILHANNYCGITNTSISALTNLTELKSAPCG